MTTRTLILLRHAKAETPGDIDDYDRALTDRGRSDADAAGSWLADAGSGIVAEYLPADALLAGYLSMREPSQLFQDFRALMTEHALLPQATE